MDDNEYLTGKDDQEGLAHPPLSDIEILSHGRVACLVLLGSDEHN